jgi:hypothetical protein
VVRQAWSFRFGSQSLATSNHSDSRSKQLLLIKKTAKHRVTRRLTDAIASKIMGAIVCDSLRWKQAQEPSRS